MAWYSLPAMGRAEARLEKETTAFRSGGCKVLQLR
jgi:hypothetical protein